MEWHVIDVEVPEYSPPSGRAPQAHIRHSTVSDTKKTSVCVLLVRSASIRMLKLATDKYLHRHTQTPHVKTVFLGLFLAKYYYKINGQCVIHWRRSICVVSFVVVVIPRAFQLECLRLSDRCL